MGVALLLAFLFGRATAPGGASSEDLSQTERKLASARAEVERLEAKLRAAREQPGAPAPSAAPGSASEVSPAPGQAGGVYVVKAGDTLWSIAKKLYGDASLGAFLAQANNLPNGDDLTIGQKLTIPPKPQKPS
ncbi:MAG: LysM peptidoglycan-binding domain-containing protein [Actinomycetota bacterium]